LEDLSTLASQLIRVANTFASPADFPVRRLLDRAYRAIEAGRKEVGMAPSMADYDVAIDFLTMSRSPEKFAPDEIKETLLDAADLIRTLKIILDAKNEIESE
jgi:hypothetical protein